MAHQQEASNPEFHAEAPPLGHPCETVMTSRAEMEREVNRRVIRQTSATSDHVEAKIPRRVDFVMTETQAVPDSRTPAAPPMESQLGISPTRALLTPMPVFSGLSPPGSVAPLGQIDPSWERINRPIYGLVDPPGRLTRQIARSVFPQPATPPFRMGPALSTPTMTSASASRAAPGAPQQF